MLLFWLLLAAAPDAELAVFEASNFQMGHPSQ